MSSIMRRPGSGAGGSEPAGLARKTDCVDAVARTELGNRIGEVVAYRGRRQEQRGTDLLGGAATGRGPEHLCLAWCQWVVSDLQRVRHEIRVEEPLPLRHAADRVGQLLG